MEKKLKVGIIGLGIGRVHISGYKSHPSVDVAAICDLDKARLEACAREFSIPKTYSAPDEMFRDADLDAVSIATPNKFHTPLTLSALNAGLHVLCEKPMAMNTAEAIKMNQAAKKARKKLMINFSFRFSPMSFALKRQVESGVVGDIYYGRTLWHRRRGLPGFGGWFGIRELAGGGPLIDLGVHRLDLALWLMGYPEPKSAFGSTYNMIAKKMAKEQNKKFSVEDLACGIVKFKNNATLILEASWALNIHDAEYMETLLCGTKGGLRQRNVNGGFELEAEVYTNEGPGSFHKEIRQDTGRCPSILS